MTIEAQPRSVMGAPRMHLPDAVSPYEIADIILTPAVHSIMQETGDMMVVDKDQSSVSIRIGGWLHYKLRDRQNDGLLWEPTRLTPWPYRHNDDEVSSGFRVEESTYWLDPRYPMTDVFTPEDADFITNPFEHLPYDEPTPEALRAWIDTWERVSSHPERIYPGQYMRHHIPGLRQHILRESKDLLRKKGYTHITAVPTWFHTAALYDHLGFSYTYAQDKNQVEALQGRLPQGTKEDRVLSSWIVMRQFWAELVEAQGLEPESFVADSMILRDENGNLLTFPLTPDRNLWMEQAL